jgi:hypothetical protein
LPPQIIDVLQPDTVFGVCYRGFRRGPRGNLSLLCGLQNANDEICGATIYKFTLKPELNKPLFYRVYDHQESQMSRLGGTSPPPRHVPDNYNPEERQDEWQAYCQLGFGDPHGTSNEVGGHFVNGV